MCCMEGHEQAHETCIQLHTPSTTWGLFSSFLGGQSTTKGNSNTTFDHLEVRF